VCKRLVEPHGSSPASESRVRSLDGLRGLAAFVVLFHHALLASAPTLAGTYLARIYEYDYLPIPAGLLPSKGSPGWLISYSPLHIFWAGPEFVVVFFVLSGFVLSLPASRGGHMRVAAYYPARLLRLYLPVWGALVFATAMHLAVGHDVVGGATWWLDSHSHPLTFGALREDALLTSKAGDFGFIGVLWSLRWEVLFSLMLPVLLVIPLGSRAVRVAVVLLSFTLLLYGEGSFTSYMPPFVLGMVLAFEVERIERVALLLRSRSMASRAAKLVLGGACVCLLTADWWIVEGRTADALISLGACLAVVCALILVSWRRLFESTPMQWTGRRAFSLYLVHEPLLVALAFALGGLVAPLPFLILASVVSIGVCAIFFRFVEAPSHHFARALGARCGLSVASLKDHPSELIAVPRA
jgi:peptidoglycan/LPS O-acetylase OafA/YrhL